MATKTSASVKIGRVGRGRQVVIPREMIESLNLRDGDLVAFKKQANGVLVKAGAVDPDDVLTPEQAKRLRQSLRQMRQGKTQTLAQVKHDLEL